MLEKLSIHRFLVIDIETVPEYPHFQDFPEKLKPLWEKKVGRFRINDETDEELYHRRTGILAEFSKVVCIGLGYFFPEEKRQFRIKCFKGDDEFQILKDFKDLLDMHFPRASKTSLTGHNIKEFDVPFLCRRMLINGIKLPNLLNVTGKKPWEVNFIDTLQLWRFGDYKHYTSLDLLCQVLKVPTSKTQLDGSKVAAAYLEKGGLEKIADYCMQDVRAVADIILKLRGEELLNSEEIEFAL